MRALGRRLVAFYWGDGIADDIPALTYYLVLSLAPVALGLAAVEALLLPDSVSALDVVRELNRFLPESVHRDVEQLVLGTRDNSPLLLALAIAAMLWTTSGAIGVLERCISRILDAERHAIVTGRLRNMLLGAGVALVFALGVVSAPTVGKVAEALDFGGRVPGLPALLAQVAGSVVVLAFVYRHVPRRLLAWRSALLGAVPAAIGVQLVPTLVAAYVSAAAGFAAARVFLVLAVVLFGLYAIAFALLVGAAVAARLERRTRARAAPGSPPAGPAQPATAAPEQHARA